MSKQISKRWKLDVRELVSEYSFSEVVVFDSSHGPSREVARETFKEKMGSELEINKKCDFCGSHLRYVAIVKGDGTDTITKTVGCDCLEIVLGKTHALSRTVRRRVRDLAKRAKLRKQREQNLERFKDELPILEVINSSDYGDEGLKSAYRAITKGHNVSERWERFIKDTVGRLQFNFTTYSEEINSIKEIIDRGNSDRFTRDMYFALMNGRSISERMLSSIHDLIKRNDPEVLAELEKDLEENINPKLDKLIEMIEYVDGDRIVYYPQFSAYGFITDIKARLNSTKRLSQRQIDAIERVYKKYTKSVENKKKKLEREERKRKKELEKVS